jgi:hypothetical protein
MLLHGKLQDVVVKYAEHFKTAKWHFRPMFILAFLSLLIYNRGSKSRRILMKFEININQKGG